MGAYEDNPLTIHCGSCSSPAEFDIVRQNYLCGHCGARTDIGQALRAKKSWRDARQVRFHNEIGKLKETVYTCSSCGAKVVMGDREALSRCGFCDGKLVRREFLSEDSFPELVIPFQITQEEAGERLLRWCEENKSKPEAGIVRQDAKRLCGFYLPYQLVRGAVSCLVSRDASYRTYRCGGYLDGISINTSSQLDNEVLDAMEPFDWSGVREFDFGYLAGQRVKLQDIDGAVLQRRAVTEVKEKYAPTVSKVMQTKGVEITPSIDNMLIMPVLLPAYVLNCGKVKVALNGQTGRVAVSAKKEKKDRSWYVEPILITVAAFLVTFFLAHRQWDSLEDGFKFGGGAALIVGLIAWTAYGENRWDRFFRPIFRSGDVVAGRQDGELVYKKDAGAAGNNAAPVFFETMQGGIVPVKIRFYSAGRIARWTFLLFLWNTLPLLLAFLLAGFDTRPMWMGGLVVWLCVSIPTTPAFIMKFFRLEVYDHPILLRILEDDRTVPVPREKRNRQMFREIWAGFRGVPLPLVWALLAFPLIVAFVIAFGGLV
jgi:DNA-directed RNA polymerase subunit RPC12/RpoP